MLPRLPGRLSSCLLLLALAAGCGYPAIPGTLVGESAHFRLYIDPDIDPNSLPAVIQGGGGLDALETDWADKQTMLKMPEGKPKIDYHLVAPEHVEAACGGNDDGGCERGDTLQIVAGTSLPFQHELIHAYMQLVAPGALPVPLVVEGTAQAIGCYGLTVGTPISYDVPWQQVVMETRGDVYSEGGLFVRYLIRTQGIDALVRYYRQAPGRRDQALFAANFSAFWSMSIDDVWTAMHVVSPGAATTDAPICPCSLPAVPTDGQPPNNNPATNPYWTLPDTAGASLALTAPSGQGVLFSDCEGVAPYFESILSTAQIRQANAASYADVALTIVQLPAYGQRLYSVTPVSTASVGQYIADSCDATAPYHLPADFVNGSGEVSIIVSQTTTEATTKYLQLQVPSAGLVTPDPSLATCDSCAFDQGSCVPPPALSPVGLTSTVAPGTLNVEWLLPALAQGTALPYLAEAGIQFTN
jgi:hypothetical protein